ncbi:MAG: DUF6320 domain-containing protein [Bilifractor sp.]|jgi:hypothetical protein
MQQCNRCHVQIRGRKRCCPLCGGPLAGEPENPAFPSLPKRKFSRLSAVRLAAFLLIALLTSDGAMIYITGGVPSWIPLSVLSAAVGFIDICVTMYYRNNVLKTMQVQVVTGIVLSLVIDAVTGWHKWSIHWVMPVAFVGVMVTTILIGIGLKMALQEFVLYLLLDTVLSLLQWIFLLRHINTFPVPAVTSSAACILMFVGILIFRWRDFTSASSRYFNI